MLVLAAAMAIGVGAAWITSDFEPVSPAANICPLETPYAVQVKQGQATFDFPFEAGGRYRLIISSLAAEDVETPVKLTAEEVAGVERFPLREVAPIQSAIPQGFHTTWNPKPRLKNRIHVAETPSQRTFFLHVTDGPLDDPRQYAKVNAIEVAKGKFVRVFLDSQMEARQLARGLVAEIVRLFDEEIVPGSRDVLGHYRDVDGDGTFAILISPWLGKLQGGQTSLGGFVRGSDFQRAARAPFSNRADVLYLNANLQPGAHLKTLLAHEFAHAICFSERAPTKNRPEEYPIEEDWLNEAIAHLAENLHRGGWTNLDHRVSQFLDATHESPLVVSNYYATGLWRDPGCRGATYLFLRWVVDQFGTDVLSRLVHNPEQGIRNLESATGAAFPDLFRGWTIALARAGQNTAGEDKTNPGRFSSIDLGQPLGRWSLQGTRATAWDIEAGEQSFSLKGTTTKILELHANHTGVFRLRVRSQGQPRLQVTIIKQAENPPPTIVSAAWQHAEADSSTGKSSVQVQIDSEFDSHLKILRLAVECRQGNHRQSVLIEAPQPLNIVDSEEDDRSRSTFAIDLPSRMFPVQEVSSTTATWHIKVLLEDETGLRFAHWLDLPTPRISLPANPPHLASRPGKTLL